MAIKVFPAPPGTAQGPMYSPDDVALILGLFGGTYWSINAGVIEGAEDELVADVSGPEIIIGAGRAIVNGRYYINDEAIAFKPSRNPSIDTTTMRIVLDVRWDVEHVGGISANLTLMEGNDGIQVAPPLTQVPGSKYQIPLWTFNVGTDGVITNLVDERVFAASNLPVDGTTPSVTAPNAMVAWAVVDLVAGDSPTVLESHGDIEIYDGYLNTGSTAGNQEFVVYIYAKFGASTDGMTLYVVSASIDGDVGDVTSVSSLSESPSEFTTPGSFDPPGAPWGQVLSVDRLSTQVTDWDSQTNKCSIVNDAGKIIVIAWGVQP